MRTLRREPLIPSLNIAIVIPLQFILMVDIFFRTIKCSVTFVRGFGCNVCDDDRIYVQIDFKQTTDYVLYTVQHIERFTLVIWHTSAHTLIF